MPLRAAAKASRRARCLARLLVLPVAGQLTRLLPVVGRRRLPECGLPDRGLVKSGLPVPGLPVSRLPVSRLADSGLPVAGLASSGGCGGRGLAWSGLAESLLRVRRLSVAGLIRLRPEPGLRGLSVGRRVGLLSVGGRAGLLSVGRRVGLLSVGGRVRLLALARLPPDLRGILAPVPTLARLLARARRLCLLAVTGLCLLAVTGLCLLAVTGLCLLVESRLSGLAISLLAVAGLLISGLSILLPSSGLVGRRLRAIPRHGRLPELGPIWPGTALLRTVAWLGLVLVLAP